MVRAPQTLQRLHQRILPSNPLRRRSHPVQEQAILDVPSHSQDRYYYRVSELELGSRDQGLGVYADQIS